jgi:succinate-acetate transporter protein
MGKKPLTTKNKKDLKRMSEKKANPAVLGLLGFGMTTILLNFIHNFRTPNPIDGVILAMGIFYGGIAQIIAGVLEYKRGDTFGTVAFSSYGFFWLSFVALNWLGAAGVASKGIWPFSMYAPAISDYTTNLTWLVGQEALMAYFFMWGLFTLLMFFGTLKKNRALQFVFASLATLFFLLTVKSAILAYTSWTTTDLELFTRIIGIEGMACGFSAFYLAIAEVLNEEHGRTVLPIGPVSE